VHNRRGIQIGLVLLLAIVVVGGVVLWRNQHTSSQARATAINAELLAKLQQKPNTTIDVSHLASGVIPPTNHWFSGLALNKEPKVVFPLPLSFKPRGTGFDFGKPQVNVTANTIAGGYNPAVAVSLSASKYQVSRYDSLSVSLRYSAEDGSELGTLTIAEGSPFVSYQAKSAQSVQLNGFAKAGDNVYSTTIGGVKYGLAVSNGATVSSSKLQLPAKASAVWYAVADGMTVADMANYATSPLQSVDSTYGVGSNVTTDLHYKTDAGRTIYAALPEQNITGSNKLAGSYQTIYGKLQLYSGNTFSFTTPKVMPTTTLSADKLSSADKASLSTAVQMDTITTNLTKTDSYYGGKELYRAANLYALAKELGQDKQADTLKSAIETDFAQWFDPDGYQVRDGRYFYYDTTTKGLVGSIASYGSEQFNDHHFHYGYFLYAMAVMAKYDHGFAEKYKDFTQLLADDIAAPTESAYFPKQRAFDPYFGHSWASGYGQFDDGNNQESTSEAINAWNGLGAWAAAMGDTQTSDQATWQLSREFATADAQWTTPDLASFKGFNHPTIGINWGGKRDYSTFFSAEPAAIFGIQLIPMNPAMTALSRHGDRIASNLSATLPTGDYNQQFGDYLLMYRAIIDKPGALADMQQLTTKSIDDANSKAYVLAWILTRK
jgi:endo-1,3(4)-beta-glucanase